MRSILPLALASVLPAALCAQEPLPAEVQQAFEQFIKLPDVLEPVLSEAKDRTTADAVAAKIEELLPQVYDTRTALQNIKELSPEVAAELRRRYELPMRERWGAIYREIFRLQRANCFGSAALSKEFHILCMMLNQ